MVMIRLRIGYEHTYALAFDGESETVEKSHPHAGITHQFSTTPSGRSH